ncbi:cell division cycle protein 123 homolog [Amphibalanus amphitrite]|uniref:cell division cycle protein 123 homolog n=1 Tax=Amphibalanus amphitrite TaxID=1232801 RepID=UPI001C90EAC6|nr:cell division cycle protein 123 homolog [Amphibalanus amphitrite]XP_043230808.1 cell division cycle protein 123 homolog [Amphibalanus amphitrite]XP_043230809.1 cell division cycle protein 123 homolog [Amphibalanus amphitrite]XP_043230810.1 cell division cycle protein 123 homolog [Amphibalanus amphitrite]
MMEFTRKVSDVLACSFSSWYPLFEKVTTKSVWVPVPAEVAAYIRSGGTVVSSEATTADTNTDDEEDSVDWEAAEEGADELQRPEFAPFDAELRAAVAAVGGAAFVKLNWSAPADVRWLSVGRALRCQSPEDVHLLLRSSGRLQRDLCTPFEGCADAGAASADLHLVVRRWEDINPAAEFRCFVVEGHLIAISQREISQYFPHLERDSSSIITDITSFFKEKIQAKFPLQNYVFDVYRSTKDHVRLVDFSPLAPPTDPALFTWGQLTGKHCLRCESAPSPGSPLCVGCASAGGALPVFQYIAGADSIQRAPYADAELPYDVHHLAESGGTAAILQLLQKSQNLGKSDQSTDDEDG